NDVRRLKQLGDALRATFAVNLAAGAKLSPAIGISLDGISDAQRARIVYHDYTELSYECILQGAKTFNVAMIQEDIRRGQRIESFALDIRDGGAWREIAKGTTIGWKKLLRFPSVTTERVRLRILKARAEPAVPEFGLYLDPARSSAGAGDAPPPAGAL
ncbi:MAG: hypothetical protein ABFD80_04490, partial [Acidobacteriota bacterium]